MSHDVPGREELLHRLAELQRETSRIESLLEPDRSPLSGDAQSTLLSLVSRHSTDLLSIHTIQGEYLWASSSARQFLQVPPEELAGRSAYDFFHHVDVEQVAESHARHLEEPDTELSVRYRLAPVRGNPRWVESHSRVTPDGELLISVTRDIDDELDQTDPGSRGGQTRRSELAELDHIATKESVADALERELDRARRRGHELSVAMFDIDQFSRIGDELGHSESLRVLKNISFLLKKNQRIYDTLGRWGRDEFLLMLPETSVAQASIAAERYRRSIEAARIVSRGRPVTISAGLASANRVPRVSDVIAQVDEALHHAKESGRNCIATFPGH